MRCASGWLSGLLVGLWSVSSGSLAWGLDKRPDISLFDPATDAGRYLSVHDSETMLQGRWNVGFYLDYARKPIELRNVTTNQRFDIVRDSLSAHVTGAMGVTDWFAAGVDIPVTFWLAFFDPNAQRTTLGNAPKQNKAGIGDIRLETKFQLLDIERYNFGIAVVPYMLFPSGRKNTFISGERWAPGAKVALEGNIRDRVWISGNVGYQFVHRENQYFAGNASAIMNDLLTFSVGGRARINDEWAVLTEVLSETLAKNIFKFGTQTPVEVVGGVQFTPQRGAARGLGVTLGGGAGVTRGVGAPQAHVLVGVTYPTPKVVHVRGPEVKIEEKIVITQKIHFAFNSASVRAISYPILDDVVSILVANPHITRVQVEGHTDFIGGDAYNVRLSQRRADAVVQYLVNKGIARDRLAPVGYGESRPIADNNTDEGRAKNRRTEFTIL